MTTEQDLIDQLTATGDYKVIRRLKAVDRYHDDTPRGRERFPLSRSG